MRASGKTCNVLLFFYRYGEHSTPFCVLVVNGCRRADGEFSRRIHDAVERASLDVQSGSSSDEEEEDDSSANTSNLSALCPLQAQPSNPEPKTIPTVSNPNSVYRVGQTGSVLKCISRGIILLLPILSCKYESHIGLQWR